MLLPICGWLHLFSLAMQQQAICLAPWSQTCVLASQMQLLLLSLQEQAAALFDMELGSSKCRQQLFALDEQFPYYLNHGSYGATFRCDSSCCTAMRVAGAAAAAVQRQCSHSGRCAVQHAWYCLRERVNCWQHCVFPEAQSSHSMLLLAPFSANSFGCV
jgi:hypothetical protein